MNFNNNYKAASLFGLLLALISAPTMISCSGDDSQSADSERNQNSSVSNYSIVWIGSFASSNEISNPQYLWAYYNTTDGSSYIYTPSGWELLARGGNNGSNGDVGDKGESCTVVRNALNDGAIVTCGNSSVEIKDGSNGEDGGTGSSCTVIRNTTNDGAIVTCGNSSVEVKDGSKGEDGGAGTSCTVVRNTTNDGAVVTCGNSSVEIKDGSNGETGVGCNVVQNENGADVTCGDMTVSIVNGTVGKSAYEIALEHGFIGSEEDWLESLKIHSSSSSKNEVFSSSSENEFLSSSSKNVLFSSSSEDDFLSSSSIEENFELMCGSESYNPKTEFCLGDDGENYANQVWPYEKCDGEYFDTEKYYCDDNKEIKEKYDCSKYKCVTTEYLDIVYLRGGYYGEFLDVRDNRVYKTITINKQTWMAQSLSYDYPEGSFGCSFASDANCDAYGRLYLWSAAMDSLGDFSEMGKSCGNGLICNSSGTVRGVCPEGWHLPSKKEWEVLSDEGGRMGFYVAENVWSFEAWRGNISQAFAAMPAGRYVPSKSNYPYYFRGERAEFWSSTENSAGFVTSFVMSGGSASALTEIYTYGDKSYGVSVRCIKD